MNKFEEAINNIIKSYQEDDIAWHLAYSGGKDSTCLLILLYNALLRIPYHRKPVNIVYCDTGVEMPCIRDSVIRTLNRIGTESASDRLPLQTTIALPNEDDRFFVNVIGRGYMPPTFMFRWCTKRLRIKPLQSIVKNDLTNIIMLGTRKDESQERNRVLEKHQISEYLFKQANYQNSLLFCPVINFTVDDVWKCIDYYSKPLAINRKELNFFYEGIMGGVSDNVVSEKGRYGCWTCTVVRKDHAGESLLKKGYKEMESLLHYRQLLLDMRSNMIYREKYRRNGDLGKGPFTLDARKHLLDELIRIQNNLSIDLIGANEISIIQSIWENELLISLSKEYA